MRALRLPFLALLLATALAACDTGPGDSLYDPEMTGGPAPVISAIAPEGVVLAGIDEITITGQNFSATPDHNIVYFDDATGAVAQGTVTEASPTRLVVRVPNLPNPSLRVRVAILGSPDFSNAISRPLTSAVDPFGGIGRTEEPFGIGSDAAGNLYLSLFDAGVSKGVVRIAPNGTRSDYFTTTFPWADLAFGNGTLYGVRRIRALFELPAGGAQRVVSAFQPSNLALATVTVGPDGTVYTGGNGGSIYVVPPAGAAATAPFTPTVRDLYATDDALYVVGQEGTASRVWRLPIAASGPGAPTVVATLPAGSGAATSLVVAADGSVLVGTEATSNPIVVVAPDGSTSTLYPGVLSGPVTGLAWADGTGLYVVRGAATGVLPNVFRVETRRQPSR